MPKAERASRLVSLDLAVALLKSGQTEALKTLASEILPIFESRGLTTEAIVAYTLLLRLTNRAF